MSTLRLLVADDHEVVRKGLVTIIEEQPGWKVIAQARDGRQTIQEAARLKPDVIILDIGMPVLNGLEAARQIIKSDSQVKILILTVHEYDQLIQQVMRAGAHGYLLKTDAATELVSAITAIHQKQLFFSPKIARAGRQVFSRTDPGSKEAAFSLLTPRQREIVQLLAEGKSNKEVAAVLGLSVKTADTHRTNIMRRLDCHCVSELVRYAIRNHIVEA